MRLDYMAHSCFLVESRGFRVLFDPYHPRVGYAPPKVYNPDLLVVSHDHFDHNAVEQVSGASQVVRGVARRKFGPLVLDGQVGWHGEAEEADAVALTLLEWEGKRLAHFGDIGRDLEDEQIDFFKGLDLLLIPCGGDYTFNGAQSAQLVRVLRPKIVVPMHYRTPFLDRGAFPNLEGVDSFLESCQDFAEIKTERSGSLDLLESWQSAADESVTVYHIQHQMT